MEINMNLQLFAENVNVTTDAGLSAENKSFYDRALLEEASANLVHNQVRSEASHPQKRAASALSSAAMLRCPRPPSP